MYLVLKLIKDPLPPTLMVSCRHGRHGDWMLKSGDQILEIYLFWSPDNSYFGDQNLLHYINALLMQYNVSKLFALKRLVSQLEV